MPLHFVEIALKYVRVKINLHELLLENRKESVEKGYSNFNERMAWKMWKQWECCEENG
jgi:hypothetical protein